ncbi:MULTISPECIES: hypothetical protein [unclassified Pseudomonas]|uniref:hypothetical protein n=1 Tax=unclassified Pseudomonas TaxID=196821 RepID=UPI0007CFD3DD|nr:MULTISPECIES: hypothetical protein [unclassified Pseudomonas]MBB6285667.1 hypothetical protein [Pseudomonas sp. SJZ073]MBB6312409.1 hypothetical protein [Pseudomonas sp. JAI120]OAE10755.1 hypothetical protein AZH11_24830 [Pseudomonas simiae]
MTDAIKKRIMFSPDYDFYFTTYALLVSLDALGCKKGRYFKDYRKLAFLVEFATEDKLVSILERPDGKDLNRIDKEYLFKSYTNGLSRRSEILKILFRLEKSGFVILRKGDINSLVDVSLSELIPKSFFDKNFFHSEYSNVRRTTAQIKQLTRLTLDTTIQKIYEAHGVKTWDF